MKTYIRYIWWLNPITIYVFQLLLVLIAFCISPMTYNLYFLSEKGLDLEILTLHFLCFVFFCIGYWYSKICKFGHELRFNIELESKIQKAFFMSACIVVLGYFIWYSNAFSIHGSNLFNIMINSSLRSEYMYEIIDMPGRIAGVTSFVSISAICGPLGVWVLFNTSSVSIKKRTKWLFMIILFLCCIRALAFSSRVGAIEFIIPSLIMFFGITRMKYNSRKVIFYFPILAIIFLVFFFGVFEYSRSWIPIYSNIYDSFWEYIVVRISGYYIMAVNSEAFIVKEMDTTFFPFHTLEFLWNIPIVRDAYQALGDVSLFHKGFSIILKHCNPQYNNEGAILAFYRDFGIFFPFFYVLFGFIIGRFYRGYLQQNIYGLILYSIAVYGLLELPRYFYFGSARAVPVYIGLIFLFLFFSSKSKQKFVKY